MFELTLETDVRFRDLLQHDRAALAIGTYRGMVRTGRQWLAAQRRQIRRALGERMTRTVHLRIDPPKMPTHTGTPVAVWLASSAIVKRPSGRVDLLEIFDRETTTRPVLKHARAIAMPGIGRGPRGRKLTPADFPPGFFRVLVVRRLGIAFLVRADDRSRRPQPYFLLTTKPTRTPKLLDRAHEWNRATLRVGEHILREYDRAIAQLERAGVRRAA